MSETTNVVIPTRYEDNPAVLSREDLAALAILCEYALGSGAADSGLVEAAERLRYHVPYLTVTAEGTCPRHDGAWGEDLTCQNCVDDDGHPRPRG